MDGGVPNLISSALGPFLPFHLSPFAFVGMTGSGVSNVTGTADYPFQPRLFRIEQCCVCVRFAEHASTSETATQRVLDSLRLIARCGS